MNWTYLSASALLVSVAHRVKDDSNSEAVLHVWSSQWNEFGFDHSASFCGI